MRKPLKIGPAYAVAVSPDETRVVALGRFVFVWDLHRGKKAFRSHPFAHPSDASFSPNGEHIAVKSTSGRIALVAADDGRTEADFKNESDGEGSNLAYSACAEFLVDGSWSGHLRVRQSTRGTITFDERFPHEMITAIHRDVTGQRWIVEHQPIIRSGEKFLRPAYFSAWEWPFRSKMYCVLPYRVERCISSALSADGGRLAIVRGGLAATLEVFEPPNTVALCSLPIKVGGTGAALCWSPDGRFLGSVQDKRIAIYQAPEFSCVAEYERSYPSDIAFCPRSDLVVLGDWQQGLVAAADW
jgi:WD40 repeat protein